MIQGKVTDVSPGTEEYALRARFPHGVPAVSDASQSDWMGYVYMQKERPTNTIGVNVTLSVLDSNGNTYNIGNATTDASGAYSLMWQPSILGKYTIFASFAGTNSYYPSSAETAVGVVEAQRKLLQLQQQRQRLHLLPRQQRRQLRLRRLRLRQRHLRQDKD